MGFLVGFFVAVGVLVAVGVGVKVGVGVGVSVGVRVGVWVGVRVGLPNMLAWMGAAELRAAAIRRGMANQASTAAAASMHSITGKTHLPGRRAVLAGFAGIAGPVVAARAGLENQAGEWAGVTWVGAGGETGTAVSVLAADVVCSLS